uniref:Uncharacterized protein n=1 Tax=Rhizophora mucronata TaxID=61149 RepID=A0A2P2N4I9_RHIMU
MIHSYEFRHLACCAPFRVLNLGGSELQVRAL